jgi:hypothetical protein
LVVTQHSESSTSALVDEARRVGDRSRCRSTSGGRCFCRRLKDAECCRSRRIAGRHRPRMIAHEGTPSLGAGTARHGDESRAARWCAVAAREHFRAESRERRAGMRFFRSGHGDVPRLLRVRGVGGRLATDPALEHNRASDGGMDGAQFRMVMSGEEPYRFVIHDHDSI